MLCKINYHVKSLSVDYTTFCLNNLPSVSRVIQIYCTSLEEANIIGFSDVQIEIPAVDSLKRLVAIDCKFPIEQNRFKESVYGIETVV